MFSKTEKILKIKMVLMTKKVLKATGKHGLGEC